MNLPNTPSKKVQTSATPRIRALVTAMALSITACVSPQSARPADNLSGAAEITEYDIDDPVFVALVSIGAEVQAGMECPENRSLQLIWETVSERLQEMNLKHDVSVSLCTPQLTERGFAYILIDVAGQQIQVFAKDQKTAQQRTKEIQESCITYIVNRMQLLLGDNPATKEKLHIILQDEEKVFEKHRMTAIVQQNDNRTWTISFEADAS